MGFCDGVEAFASRLRGAEIAASSDRKSTRLNSSHSQISYAVFCLKKKNEDTQHPDQYLLRWIVDGAKYVVALYPYPQVSIHPIRYSLINHVNTHSSRAIATAYSQS